MEQKYYIENFDKGTVDGFILWWKIGDHGYTTDLNEARMFTENEANMLLKKPGKKKFKKHKIDGLKIYIERKVKKGKKAKAKRTYENK